MKRIVLMTHAGMASGMKETAEFIAGEQGVIAFNCFAGITTDQAIQEIVSQTSPNDTLVILTDLCGGSVNQRAALMLANRGFYLISGVNLPLLLELSMADEDEITPDFIRQAIESSKQEIIFMNDRLAKPDEEVSESFFD